MALRKSKLDRRHLKSSRARKRRRQQKLGSKLSFEKLEDRQLLATFVVSNLNDSGSGSLRDAIDLANNAGGSDLILFDGNAESGVIRLTSGELMITDSLAIFGPGVTIDAQQNSRVLNFEPTSNTGDLILRDITVTGGRTTGSNGFSFGDDFHSGGGIRFAGGTFGLLTLNGVTLTGNRTEGERAEGGGAFSSGFMSVIDSTIEGNWTTNFGSRGGGIYSFRAANLLRSEVTGNRTEGRGGFGGGIGSSYNVVLTESTVSGNRTTENNTRGGGIATFDDVIAVNSSISGNSTAGEESRGGGISAVGVRLTNTTVSGNTTTGLAARGAGFSAYEVTLNNATISGNRATGSDARGGGIYVERDATINNSTITENFASGGGHGIAIGDGEDGTVRVENSIVSGNNPGGFLDISLSDAGTFIANYSFLGSTFPGGIGGTGNIFSQTPMLGSLSDNGGPSQTHAPLSGSNVIDAGDPSIVFDANEYDQRNAPFVRVFDADNANGARIDMGAFELQSLPASLFVVDSTSDIDDGNFSDGQFTLREAINLANVNPGRDTITFDSSVAGGTINLTGTEMEITETITIDATALPTTAGQLEIDANGLSRIFLASNTNGNVTIAGLSLTGGRTSGGFHAGGAIFSVTSGLLTLDQTSVDRNRTTGQESPGGAIRAEGNVLLRNSSVSSNETTGAFSFGGGISAGGNVTVTDSSTVSNNRTLAAETPGGGIRSGGDVFVTDSSEVNRNTTLGLRSSGGGIDSQGGVTIIDSDVHQNRTMGDFAVGGAIRARVNVTINDSVIFANATEGDDAGGGAIYSNFDVFVSGASRLISNDTQGDDSFGGAIYARSDVFIQLESEVTGNTTEGQGSLGGGVYAMGNVSIRSGSEVTGNTTVGDAASGGGIYAGGDVSIFGSEVAQNSTAGFLATGGGFHAVGDVTIAESTIRLNGTSGNFADGGGFYASSGFTSVTNSTVSENTTAGDGAKGAGLSAVGELNVTNSTISGNSTTGDFAAGGGISGLPAGLGTIRTEPITITNSTVANNRQSSFAYGEQGGGIYSTSRPVTIANSIIAGNIAAADSSDINTDGGSLNVDYSLIEQSNLTISGGNNIIGLPANLGPLFANGGPTETHALLPDSPAIDAGSAALAVDQSGAALVTDQRGTERVFDGNNDGQSQVDIGSYELQRIQLVVDNLTDEDDGNFSVGDLSLREAIGIASNAAGSSISFDSALFATSQTISLSLGEIEVLASVLIEGPGQELLTIDAQEQSRIFNFTATAGDITFSGMSLVGGRTNVTGNAGAGGAIRSRTSGLLTLNDVAIRDSETAGQTALGGGVSGLGPVAVVDSTISGNATRGVNGAGGGISSYGSVTLIRSTLSDNTTMADNGAGGGIFATGFVSLTDSTVSGNQTQGDDAAGGGILNGAAGVTLTNSTVSGNQTFGDESDGGGIRTQGEIVISSSTVAMNSTSFSGTTGGGIWNNNDTITITNSIVADNSSPGMEDIAPGTGALNVNYSLVSNLTGLNITGEDNVFGVSARLLNLADNGGSTQTHALGADSPAIDMGDPSIAFNSSEFDQRGAPFARVTDGRIDIGAFEFGSTAAAPTVTSAFVDEGGVLVRPDLWETLTVAFDQDVSISSAALSIVNDTLGGTAVGLGQPTFNYNSADFTATWIFDLTSPLLPAFYTYSLDASLITSNGFQLEGEGLVAQHYVALPGDANLDGQVNVLDDAFALVGNLGTAGGATWAQGDFNGDGAVDVLGDAFILIGRLGQSVVPPAATASVAMGSSSTTANYATAAPVVLTSTAPQPVSFISQQEDDRDQNSGTQRAKKSPGSAVLSLAGSKNLDAAFESSDLTEVGIF